MPHPDADDLALLALGESLGSAVDAHVAGCESCTAEIERFRETVGLAGLSNYGEDAPRPGEHVWAAIATELGFDQQSHGDVATAIGDPHPAAEPNSLLPRQPIPGDASHNQATSQDGNDAYAGIATPFLRAVPEVDPADTDRSRTDAGSLGAVSGGTGAGPHPPPPPVAAQAAAPARRWSRWAAPLAAAVVGIAVGAGAVVVSQNRSDDVTIEATAPLTPVVGGPLTNDQQEQLGKAELVVAPTGQEVRVSAADLPPSADSYEVWLFGDDGRMVSLGTLSEGSGSFVVPEGISTREYRVVDVSDEPPDGNPLHSGVSLIRGAFS